MYANTAYFISAVEKLVLAFLLMQNVVETQETDFKNLFCFNWIRICVCIIKGLIPYLSSTFLSVFVYFVKIFHRSL